VLTALDQRTARLPPHRQQLGLLVGARVIASALERSRQQRVRERLSRDPFRVEHV